MYDAVVRFYYRIFAPRHPRGRVPMHAVFEPTGSTLWVHTHGMTQWSLYDIELVVVPYDLRGYAHGLLFELMGYMKNQKPILPDQSIGGDFVSDDQPVHHFAHARLVDRPADPDHRTMLRFVDLDAPVDSGFPARLFSAHIVALASAERSPVKRERMLRRATEVLTVTRDADTDDPHKNANNWVAWEALGSALFDLGRVDDGLGCLNRASELCPSCMRSLAVHYREAIDRGELPSPEKDPRAQFWHERGR